MNLFSNYLFYTVFLLFFCFSNSVFAQQDSLLLKNENQIVGEVKGMKQAVMQMKTSYSDSDFKIEWDKITSIHTQTEFLITLNSGLRYNASLKSKNKEEIFLLSKTDTLATVNLDDIVFLNEVKSNFLSNLDAAVSVGFNYTKAKDLAQLSVRSNLGYRARYWELSANYNDVRSSQNNTEPVKRVDASLGYKYYLKRKWFLLAETSWLSNTEQNLNLRTLGKLGAGRYLIQTNRTYWGLQLGVSYNNENFEVEGVEKSNNSAEAFLGTELNLYNVGDLSLLTRAVAYPSLTESGRWRLDYNLDVKYDLPLNLFVNFGITLNYDNQPAENASETDYILQTTVGWDF